MSNALVESWRRYRALPTPQRELVTFGLMFLVALTLLPLAIYIAGQVFLGEYIRDPAGSSTGGPGALWVDYVKGLLAGSRGHWLVLLGPWLLLMAGRGVLALARHERRKGQANGQIKGDINQPLA